MDASERVVVGETPEPILAEHVARYRFAAGLALENSLLDLACGTGYGSEILAGSGTKVIGVDRSTNALATAFSRHRHPSVRYVRAIGELLPFADASFAAVVCLETLEHVTEPRQLLGEIARVLVPQGKLFLSTPNRRVASPWWFLRRRPANPFHSREYTRAELEKELAEWFHVDDLWGQRFVPRKWLWLPVYTVVRGSARLFSGDWAYRLYDEASGPALASMSANREPRYFVTLCHKKAG